MRTTIDATVCLIPADPADCDATCQLVRSMGFTPAPFRSFDDLLRRHDVDRPGCLVADLQHPGMNGPDLLRELNDRENPLPAVFISSAANVADTVTLMQLGAVTLLEKPYRSRTLVDAIHAAVRLDAERRMIAGRCRELDQRLRRLSRDEQKVLQDLVTGKTNKRIAFELGIALRTVEYRRRNIYSKLEVQSIAELAATIAERERLSDIGMLLKAPPVRLANSRFRSFGMPRWLQTVARNRRVFDLPHAGAPPEHTRADTAAVRDGVPT